MATDQEYEKMSPEERERHDKLQKEKEDAEQALLPYKYVVPHWLVIWTGFFNVDLIPNWIMQVEADTAGRRCYHSCPSWNERKELGRRHQEEADQNRYQRPSTYPRRRIMQGRQGGRQYMDHR